MHRLLMLSNTYKMSSAYDPKAAAVDPENRLHWRFDVRRLEAEEIRAARSALDAVPQVMSIAQLGTRLHALVDPAVPEPEALLWRALESAGVAADVERARPSLEDVFVAATRREPS